MLEYCWMFALLLRSARYFTGVEGKWTLLHLSRRHLPYFSNFFVLLSTIVSFKRKRVASHSIYQFIFIKNHFCAWHRPLDSPFHSVEWCRHTHKRKNGLKQVPLGLRGGILVCQSQGTSPDAAWVKSHREGCLLLWTTWGDKRGDYWILLLEFGVLEV